MKFTSISKRPVIIIGKSGSGKTSVVEKLINDYKNDELKYERVVTYTTRKRRSNESEEAYHFITPQQFNEMKNEFAEYSYYSNKEDDVIVYGSKLEDYLSDESVKLIILNVEGMMNVLKKLKPSNCTVIYLKQSEEVLRKHLQERDTESQTDIDERLAIDDGQFKGVEPYTDLTINCDNLSIDAVASLIDRYVRGELY